MCASEHEWAASQHSVKWGSQLIKEAMACYWGSNNTLPKQILKHELGELSELCELSEMGEPVELGELSELGELDVLGELGNLFLTWSHHIYNLMEILKKKSLNSLLDLNLRIPHMITQLI